MTIQQTKTKKPLKLNFNSQKSTLHNAVHKAVSRLKLQKGYYNCGREPYLYYYNNKDGKEFDLYWEQEGAPFPLEIKKTSNPCMQLTNSFRVLEKSGRIIGQGGVIYFRNDFIPLNKNNSVIPVRCV